MRKFYQFFSLLMVAFFAALGATAQTDTPVKTMADLSNTAAYTIKSEGRGYMIYAPDRAADKAWCSDNTYGGATAITVDTSDPNSQWVFYQSEHGCYLYNLGAGQFLYKESSGGTTFTVDPLGYDVKLLASTSPSMWSHYGDIENYPTVIAFGGNQINLSINQIPSVFTNWNDTGDTGNIMAIVKVADVSEEIVEAIAAKVETYEATIEWPLTLKDLVNTKTYYISNGRGFWTYDPDYTFTDDNSEEYTGANMLVSSGVTGATAGLADANKEFAILKTYHGKYRLFSVAANKFVKVGAKQGTQAWDFAELTDVPALEDTLSVLTGSSAAYPNVLAIGGNQFGISNSYGANGGIINGYNDLSDEGNCVAFVESGNSFDPEDALTAAAMVECQTFLPTEVAPAAETTLRGKFTEAVLTFDDNLGWVNNMNPAYLQDAEGNELAMLMIEQSADNAFKVYPIDTTNGGAMAYEFTEPTTCKVVIPAQTAWDSKLDWDADDMGFSAGVTCNPAITLTYNVGIPAVLESVTPAEGLQEEALPTQVVLTFDQNVGELTQVMARTMFTPFRGADLLSEEGAVVVDGKTVTINIAEEYLNNAPNLVLSILGTDENGLTLGKDADTEYIQLAYEVNLPADRFTMASVEPADGDTVTSLSTITLTMASPYADDCVGGYDQSKVVVVKNAEGDTITTGTIGDPADWDWGDLRAVITLNDAITTDGVYTVVVPAASIYDVNFYEMEEDFGVESMGAIYNPEITLTYVIESGNDPYALFEYESVTPENGAEVNSLSVIKFKYPTYIAAMDYETPVAVLNEAGETVAEATFNWDYSDATYSTAVLNLNSVITTPGTYTIFVEAGYIWNDQVDWDDENYGLGKGALYNPDFTLTYTVVEPAEPEEYPINFDKDAYQTHSARILNSISLTAGDGVQQTVTLDGTKKAYQDLTDQTFTIASGDEVTVTANYTGSWMHTYVYVDLDNDKQFSFNEGGDQTGTELLGWTYIAGYNNEGVAKGENADPQTPMTFTVNAAPGTYRMRLKIDWDNQDPGGCILSTNHILNNGGHIADMTLVVTEATGISAATIDQNAKVYTLDGRRVNVSGKLNRGIYIINGKKTYVK